jgi:hypothetical protein
VVVDVENVETVADRHFTLFGSTVLTRFFPYRNR